MLYGANGMHCPLTQNITKLCRIDYTNVIGLLLLCCFNMCVESMDRCYNTATSFISLYFTKIYQNYEYGVKIVISGQLLDKKIWYLLNKSSDFKIAKKIYVFLD